MACASGGLEVDVSHRWKRNGLAWVMVQVLSPTVGRYPLGCNYNLTTVAGEETAGREEGGGDRTWSVKCIITNSILHMP